MLRILFTTALVLGAGTLLRLPGAAQAAPSGTIHAQAATGPAPHPQDRRADEAIAASVTRAISAQLDQRAVAIELEPLVVEPAGIVQRDISGRGRLRIGDDSAWIPFRFRALYDDTRQATTGAPQLVLGDDLPALLLAGESPVARHLDGALTSRLRREFTQQRVGLSLDAVHALPVGGHYLALHAQGRADFGHDGQVDTDVRALYDTRSGRWLQLDYQLGDATSAQAPAKVLAQG